MLASITQTITDGVVVEGLIVLGTVLVCVVVVRRRVAALTGA
jgi:hypothetical protein